MDEGPTSQDTYFVVFHYHWLVVLGLLTLLLVALILVVRRRTESPGIRRLATTTLLTLAIGLPLSLGATVAAHFAVVNLSADNIRWLSYLNELAIAGFVLVAIAFFLALATLLVAVINNRSR